MQIRMANSDDLAAVTEITQETILAVYPHYYPKGAVDFFLAHHHADGIRKDIAENHVFLCISDQNEAVGTVTVKQNEIARLFVLPIHQGHGYGRALLDFAEEQIAKSYDIAVLDVSFPAKNIYLKRGYRGEAFEAIPTENGDFLCHDTMQKRLTRPCAAKIRQIIENDEKTRISRMILEALPEWFEIESAREQYIAESREQHFFAAFSDGAPVGFLCLKQTGSTAVEIAVMGVLKTQHRQGIGRALFSAAKQFARREGYRFMQVKTVKMGTFPEYDITNRFYLSLGFQELEVLPELWGTDNPCLIYVMSLNEQ